MLTAQEVIPTRYVTTSRSKTPEPPLDESWSDLDQLTWHASLIMSENPGLKLYISDSKDTVNGFPVRGEYNISYGLPGESGGMSGASFDRCWRFLSGVSTGLQWAKKL